MAENPSVVFWSNKMKYFDVLLAVDDADGFAVAQYDVRTIRAANIDAARSYARATVRRENQVFGSKTRQVFRLLGVGPAGYYDKFVGKYVGQFIEEAFPCRESSSN